MIIIWNRKDALRRQTINWCGQFAKRWSKQSGNGLLYHRQSFYLPERKNAAGEDHGQRAGHSSRGNCFSGGGHWNWPDLGLQVGSDNFAHVNQCMYQLVVALEHSRVLAIFCSTVFTSDHPSTMCTLYTFNTRMVWSENCATFNREYSRVLECHL